MVFLDHLDDTRVELVLHRQVDPIFHMRDDDQRTHRRGQGVMRIFPVFMLVLDEVSRLFQLPYIVEIGADPAHRGVRADRFRGGFRQRGYHQAVMESARSLKLHLLEQLVVQVAELQPTDIGGQVEDTFKHRQQAADDHRRAQCRGESDTAARGEDLDAIHGFIAEHRHRIEFPQNQGQSHHHESYIDARPQKLNPPPHPVGAKYRRHPRHKADDKVVHHIVCGN